MIVIGTDVVENYLADHAGHKGIKAARSQYEAWLDIVTRANWRNPEDIKASYPKVSILKAGSCSTSRATIIDWWLACSTKREPWRFGSLGRMPNTTE